MIKFEADIAVVGAGAVGLAAAIACAKLGKKVVLVANKKPATKMKKAWDGRVYALTASTENWLNDLNVWQEVDKNRVNDINTMRLWNAQNDVLELRDSDANLAKLGVIIEHQNLVQALNSQLNALNVTVVTDVQCAALQNEPHKAILRLDDGKQISASLIVAADGVDSWVRSQAQIAVKHKNFHQTAIVANFLAEKPHQNIARQWFAPHETLALLPLPKQHVSMVWALSTERAAELLKLSGEVLAEQLKQATHANLDSLQLVGNVLSFVLHQQTATQLSAERLVLLGDAAHQIHPMAGQGLNLGLRDVMRLQAMLTNAHAMLDIGEAGFLRKYARERHADIASMNLLTSGLDSLFAAESSFVKDLADWGFRRLHHQSSIKKMLIEKAA